MNWQRLLKISLARKCQLLFGLALLLIIAATLFVPGYYMESFVHELNARRSRELAMTTRARINPLTADWEREQRLLDQWWEDNSKELGLPLETKPRLIPLPQTTGEIQPAAPVEAIRAHLARAPQWWTRHGTPLEKLASMSELWQLTQAGWYAIPEASRLRVINGLENTLPRTAEMIARQTLTYDPNDTFLVKALREMQTDDNLNEQVTTLRPPGQPRVYRCVLAIRGVKEGAQRRPLLGVIDVQRAAPKSDEMVLLTRAILVLAGLLAGFLAVLVFYLITQRLILAPVRELKDVADRIAGGDPSARAALTTGDEYEELSDAFNDMLSQLERSRVELETINRSLDAKLGEMAETNVALFESNRLKSEFLANVSHELRTPLTSIIGFADLLRDAAAGEGPVDKTRMARFAYNILTSGRGLLDIINDLLDLAKIEAGRIELHRHLFSLRDVCDALYDLTRPLFDKKDIAFAMDLADDLPMMNSDAGKLRQILYNLLSNASKYTPEGGSVRLEVVALDQGRSVRLSVSDTGPGIAPEQREQIFEKFRQLDSSVTREHSGTGLGLAITRELSTMLGGQIRLESELGKGSTFIVDLPVECPEVAQRRMPALT